MLPNNPYIKYAKGGANGYGLVTVEPKAATVAFRTLHSVKDARSPIATAARFAVETGRPGVESA
jgi:alkaline phosphatase D